MAIWRTPPWWTDDDGPRPLVMLTTSFPSASDPVAGLFVESLQRRLRDEGHAVEVVAARPGTMGIPEQFEGHPLAAVRRVMEASVTLWAGGLRAARRAGPRAHIVGHWVVPGGVVAHAVAHGCGVDAAHGCGVDATTIAHSSAVRAVGSLPAPLARAVLRASLGGAPWIASCEDVAGVVARVFPEAPTPTVMAMPVPPARRVGAPPSGPPWRIATLGRLVPIKGLEAFAKSLEGRAVELHVCGAGPGEAGLREACRAAQVSVVFHGVVTGERKASVLSTVHGFAQPSVALGARAEGTPAALLEAISYGLPVFVTATGGLADAAAAGPHVVAQVGVAGLREAWPAFESVLDRHWHDGGIAVR